MKKMPLILGAVSILATIGLAAPAYADDTPTPTPTESSSTSTTNPNQSLSGLATTTADDWSCNMFSTGTYAPCVENTQTTGDESWYKGYKLTFNWTVPNDWQGNPYQRCVLAYYNPKTQYSDAELAPIQVDVPADWGTYTIPLDQYGWLQDGIQAGATTLTEEYYCYTPGIGSSTRVDSDSAIIPDMPPTTPTAATTTVSDDDVDVTTGGSVALGVSPLTGYSLTVTDADGTVAQSADATVATSTTGAVAMGAERVMGASKSATLKNAVSHVFKNLKAGTYKVTVAAKNKIGLSNTITKTVTVLAPLGKSTGVSATAGKGTEKVSWKAPKSAAGLSGYTINLVRNGKIVKHITVGKTVHGYTFKKVAKGSYTVQVVALGTGNRTSTVSKSARVTKA